MTGPEATGGTMRVNVAALSDAAGRARALGAELLALQGFADVEQQALVDSFAGWSFLPQVTPCSDQWNRNVAELGGQYDGVGTRLDETVAEYDGVEAGNRQIFDVGAI